MLQRCSRNWSGVKERWTTLNSVQFLRKPVLVCMKFETEIKVHLPAGHTIHKHTAKALVEKFKGKYGNVSERSRENLWHNLRTEHLT